MSLPSNPTRTGWDDQTAQHLVRYEALFKLLDEVQAAEDIDRMATLVARQWKYFANVASFRLVLAKAGGWLVIDGFRGGARQSVVAELSPWDAWHWRLGRPRQLRLGDGPLPLEPPEHLRLPGTAEVQVLPVLRGQRCIGLLSAAARHVGFTELDHKFIRLFASHFADRVAGIVQQQETIQSLVSRATHDALTRVLNRGGIAERLSGQLALSRRTGEPLSVVMLDIDFFKSVNDLHGHPAGDAVLCELAQRLQASSRGGDAVGRYGGEEFLLVLYPCTAAEALLAAERYRMAVASRPFEPAGTDGPRLPLTVSLGCASTEGQPQVEVAELIKQADEALYRAKGEGRNRAVAARPPRHTG